MNMDEDLPRIDDPLLWRTRRAVAHANISVVRTFHDHRRALCLAAELRAHIQALTERLDFVRNEMNQTARRVAAVKAYSECAGSARRQVPAKGVGAKS
jgi:hypothetical protein